MFHIVLVEPEIPANTGSVGRTCVATQSPLHLVGNLGFSLDDKYLKRAGLDYWKHVELKQHQSWKTFRNSLQPNVSQNQGRLILFSKKAEKVYSDFRFLPNDFLVFGKETKGLDEEILNDGNALLRIPTPGPVRSLNLAVAVGIALFEAQRQNT